MFESVTKPQRGFAPRVKLRRLSRRMSCGQQDKKVLTNLARLQLQAFQTPMLQPRRARLKIVLYCIETAALGFSIEVSIEVRLQ